MYFDASLPPVSLKDVPEITHAAEAREVRLHLFLGLVAVARELEARR